MHAPLTRPQKAVRYRGYFDLQLLLAEAVSEKASMPIGEAALLYTNFHRRFGLGPPPAAGSARQWQRYAQELARLGPHAERLQWTQTFYSQSPEEKPAFPDRFFGCFNYDVDDRTGVIRFHFNNRDPEGPLREASMPERVAELARMFAHAREQFPNAKVVEGRSWLYGRDAYRRLFPDAYLRSLRLAEGSARLQGSSRWGQLIDHRGGVNSDLREMFLRNIAHLNINRIWEVFPLPTFSASAPLEVFCDHYGSAHAIPHPGDRSSQHGAAQNPLR